MTQKIQGVWRQMDFDQSAQQFRKIMGDMSWRTLEFPGPRGVYVQLCEHSKEITYMPEGDVRWTIASKSLGAKTWIAEWMRKNAGTNETYYGGIGRDAVLCAANELTTQFALPVAYAGEFTVPDGEWFSNQRCVVDLAESCYAGCKEAGMAHLNQNPVMGFFPGDTPPFLNGSVTGVIKPGTRRIRSDSLRHGTRILGVGSTGVHAGGIQFLIRKALEMPQGFLTLVPDSRLSKRTLGEEALVPTLSYAALIEALALEQIELQGLVCSADGGLCQIAFDKRPFTYWIDKWPAKIPPLFWLLRDSGVPIEECLAHLNWGIGYYIFAPEGSVDTVMAVGKRLKYDMYNLGYVSEGERKVVFREESVTLHPPG